MIKIFKILFAMIVFVSLSCEKDKAKGKMKKIKYIETPVNGNSMQPFLFSDGGEVLMSWTQKINDSLYSLNYSTLSNEKWSKSKEIIRGKDWFVNWADFPVIAQNKENTIVHFLQKSDPATFAYDVYIKQSKDKGKSWKEEYKLHQDSTFTEHGFVTILPYKDDSFFVTWLDGRNTQGGDHDHESQGEGAMNIRTATVLSNGEIIDDILVDTKTCDCCQTSAAITPKGPIIVYRNRSDEEVRDIYISRLVDKSWTIPKSIHNDNWIIKGCPVNGPKADSYKNTLVVAWFTAADKIPKVNLSFSNDNGENFASPIQIDNGKPIGRVDVTLIDEKNALVSWMETTNEGADIKILKVNIDGIKGTPYIISSISSSRGSGFPQFELVNDNVIFAWNQIDEKQSTIKTVSLPMEVLN
jgi:hypothetical protein